MRLRVEQLRQLVREERELTTELFGIGEGPDFGKLLDGVMADLNSASKKLEAAHRAAPEGTARAIVAGLHSDLFNKVAEVRKYVKQLKAIVKQGKGSAAKPERDSSSR